jgi:uncharacterized protein DUF5724/uncharacterized protein DUF4132
MLTPEQAQEALRRVRVEEWVNRRLAGLRPFPKAVDETVRAIIDPKMARQFSAHPMHWVENTLPRQAERLAEAIDGMSPAAGEALFESLFPRMGRHAEAAWRMQQRQPYQSGWTRRALRLPHHPELTRAGRGLWLQDLMNAVRGHEQDVRWFAAWAVHLLPHETQRLGGLFAAAIDSGGKDGEAVFEILRASANGEHEIGGMGRHIPVAFLQCQRPDAWEFMEQMLLAAQRQEGLRQSILEAVDFAHPEAFRRMVRLILDENLGRFSATVRAMDVWLGFQWDSAGGGSVNQVLEPLLGFLEEPSRREEALAGDDAEQVFLALWAMGFEDAMPAMDRAEALLHDERPAHRFAAAHFLTVVGLPTARERMLCLLEDDDPHLIVEGLKAINRMLEKEIRGRSDLFPRVERALDRLPEKKTSLKPLIWPWTACVIDRRELSITLVRVVGDRLIGDLLPHLQRMSARARHLVALSISRAKALRRHGERELALTLAVDSSESVRRDALEALKKIKITEREAKTLEDHLRRKPSDLRRAAIEALMHQPNPRAVASAERLIASGKKLQRLAGWEILRLMIEADRAVNSCRKILETQTTDEKTLTDDEQRFIDQISQEEIEPVTLEDGLGLFNPKEFSRAEPVRDLGVRCHSKAAVRILRSLHEVVLEHSDTLITLDTGSGSEEVPLGSGHVGRVRRDWSVPLEEDLNRLPLREVWESWLTERPATMRDRDGLELVRAKMMMRGHLDHGIPESALKRLYGSPVFSDEERGTAHTVRWVLHWLVAIEDPPGQVAFRLDAAESALASLKPQELAVRVQDFQGNEHLARPSFDHHLFHPLMTQLGDAERGWTDEHTARLWRLAKWWDTPVRPGGGLIGRAMGMAMKAVNIEIPRHRPPWRLAFAAFEAGAANRADVIDSVLGTAAEINRHHFRKMSSLGEALDRQRRDTSPECSPPLQAILSECLERVLEIELQRGDTPTAATDAALSIRRLDGIATLLRILTTLGKDSFTRGWSHDRESRASTLSHLVRVTFPAESDTPDQFAAESRRTGIKERLLLETAVYAPQWARHIEAALGWESFAEGVWWIYAHTKDRHWSVDKHIRDVWAAEVNERTPLTGEELLDGAVDVQWFHRVHSALGPERWEEIDRAAKYSSGGSGHGRARLFADAMRGELTRDACMERILTKRNQDCMRALGLIPLPESDAQEGEILSRYEAQQEFLRTGKKFGSQRRESERRAVEIGMANLARTAGYPDPLRLQWAMEQRAVADLAEGPVTVEAEGVTVTLSVDDLGDPQIAILRGERALKSVPAKLRKHGEIKALRERRTELRRQASRMRHSLEFTMIRGDEFRPKEISDFTRHPLLWPMLENLVFAQGRSLGYLSEDGGALLGFDGGSTPVDPGESLRLAHPHDLLAAGQWNEWQRECFLHERIQPFKQVFRELYPLTDAEIRDATISRRYAGHQVNPRQALALFGARGWVHHPEEGLRRTFHDAHLSAHVAVMEPLFTPADVEGITLEGVVLWRTNENRIADLTEVPPRLFSEVMRDLDLVVSVAHRGGVDPEASASTVEMRASLLRETLEVLHVDNARIESSHAFVEGALAKYSIHLGSGVVHLVPGGMLGIVPVHAQHRGRLFLPFADDDPRTAEVMTKVLMLARDREIKDPQILAQIRRSPGAV